MDCGETRRPAFLIGKSYGSKRQLLSDSTTTAPTVEEYTAPLSGSLSTQQQK